MTLEPWRTDPFCCYLDGDTTCEQPPEYHIYTQRRDGSPAGPDIYADDTTACVDHVGALLGHQPDARNPEEIVWLIMYEASAFLARTDKEGTA